MKSGGTLTERATRLFAAKGVTDLATLPKHLLAKRKEPSKPAPTGPRIPRGPLQPGQTMRPGATRLPSSQSRPKGGHKRKAPRFDAQAQRFAVDRGGASVLVDAPGTSSRRERAIMDFAREIRGPGGPV